MGYRADTIATVVTRLNQQYFLPAIQREFVWSPSQIIQLYDSIMRGYPIGGFLFWELRPENRDKWQVYKFVEDFRQRGTHNVLANTTGIPQVTLVLDGQQRLTSFIIGLKGSYTVKRPNQRWNNPNAWVKQHLYLDLLKDPKAGDDTDTGVRYGFTFPSKEPNRNLDRLYRVIWKDDGIAYYTEEDQDYDRVLDIFVRANEGGTKLSKSDLLLSMVTSKWGDVNAREEIYGFVEYLNSDLLRRNDFDKDFVMKTSLVVSDLPVQYRVENFNNQNLNLIRQNWDHIKDATERAVTLVNTFGIDRDTLTSVNALIPLIYFLSRHPGKSLLGSTPFDGRNANLIRRWLLGALLNNAFGGSSDTALTETRKILASQSSDDDFPAEALNRQLSTAGRFPEFNDYAIGEFLAITYGRRESFLALSLLYDDRNWGAIPYHVDHIFPRALFAPSKLEAAGIDHRTRDRYGDLMNRVGNLELLTAAENIVKSNQDFASWLTTRDVSFRHRHLIPDDDDLLKLQNFERFVTAREELIRERLKSIFALQSELAQSAAVA